MRRVVIVMSLMLLGQQAATAAEPVLPDQPDPMPEPTVASRPGARDHANPRLLLSYRRFSIAGLAGFANAPVPLDGGQLDLYLLSRRWIRVGLETELGGGNTGVAVGDVSLWYALGGFTVGIQYPARVMPFVEGRVAVGALGGTFRSGTTFTGQVAAASGDRAATLLYLGGVEAGIGVYTLGRAFVSISLGWAHPVYLGVDPVDLASNSTLRPVLRGADTFTFKVGLGI